MWLIFAQVIVLSLLGESSTQAPDDADPFCTEILPGVGFNILDYAPEVKPLMDSRHYQNLLPPHLNAVWQEVDNDNNNPLGTTTDWTQNTNLACRQTAFVCGFQAGTQDNWMITQHISRMVGGTAVPQVTVQVDFQLNSCTQMNNCGRTFAIHKYETSTINATAARNLSNYQFVPPRITPTDGSGDVRENSSVQIDFSTGETGVYLGIQDETSCILVHRVLVFYYVCPAETSDLISRPEMIAPSIGNSAPIVLNGQCVENSSQENGIGARFTCSQYGNWEELDGAGCVCDARFQRSLDGRSCMGCDAGMYLSVNDTCLPCPANSNSTQRGLSECPCFEGYFRAVGEPPERECTQPISTVATSTPPTNPTCTPCPMVNSRPTPECICPPTPPPETCPPVVSCPPVVECPPTPPPETCPPVVSCPPVVECQSVPCPTPLPATLPPPPAQVACVTVFYDDDKKTKLVIWDKPVGEVTVYSVRISYKDGSSGQLMNQHRSSENQWLELHSKNLPTERPLWVEVRPHNSGGTAHWSSRVELWKDDKEG